jgi:signal transduction histidine kinase
VLTWKRGRLRLFNPSADPHIVEPIDDIVGLYLAPPDHTLVLAGAGPRRNRAQGATRWKRYPSEMPAYDYGPSGVATLATALILIDRRIDVPCQVQHRTAGWLRFLDQIDRTTPPEQVLHVIVDNRATLATMRVQRWLRRHPRCCLHLTPAGVPWSSTVDHLLRGAARSRRASDGFASVPELVAALSYRCVLAETIALPFAWNRNPCDLRQGIPYRDRGFGVSPRVEAHAPAINPGSSRTERALFDLTDNIPVGTYTMVLAPGATVGRYHFVSKRFLEMLDLDRETVLSDPALQLTRLHPDDYERVLRLNMAAFAARQPFRGEMRFIVRGEIRWIAAESIPRALPDGSTLWEGVIVDITAQKDAEAAARRASERLLAAERERARLDERQRLLQDVHDGFGSQLATARLRVLDDDLDRQQLSDVLRECLDDLHLVIDTLNSPDISLENALIDYRHRMSQRLARMPIDIDWQIELDACPPLHERVILQVLRILQEALANALKHAQAKRIVVATRCCAGEAALQVVVADDGAGMPIDIVRGRGLDNMRARARVIGAGLRWERSDPGTRVVLEVPYCDGIRVAGKPDVV